jgi:hypothetical protein
LKEIHAHQERHGDAVKGTRNILHQLTTPAKLLFQMLPSKLTTWTRYTPRL